MPVSEAMRIEREDEGETVETGSRETGLTETGVAAARTKWRQCCHTMETGDRCERWASPGHEYCHSHLQYRGRSAERPVRVPLLEDTASIRFVISEVLLAMAYGTMPSANANAMLRGCQTALRLLEIEQAAEKHRKDAAGATDAAVAAATEESGNAAAEGASEAEAESERGTEMVAAWQPDEYPLDQSEDPPRLGDLHEEWDRGMLSMERAMQKNLRIKPGHMGKAWLEARNRGPESPHPMVAHAVGILGERDWEGEAADVMGG